MECCLWSTCDRGGQEDGRQGVGVDVASTGQYVRLRADHERPLLDARLAQNELQRAQRVLQHMLGANVDLHAAYINASAEAKRRSRCWTCMLHLQGTEQTIQSSSATYVRQRLRTLVMTKKTGTFNARATPRCSLHMPTTPASEQACSCAWSTWGPHTHCHLKSGGRDRPCTGELQQLLLSVNDRGARVQAQLRTCVCANNQARKVWQVPGQPIRRRLEVPLMPRQVHQGDNLCVHQTFDC